MNVYLGIDFGTSGARAIAIDEAENILAEVRSPFVLSDSRYWAKIWQDSLFFLLQQISSSLRQQIRALAINGTSATTLLCDASGKLLDVPILYNEKRGIKILKKLQAIAPANHVAASTTSSLAKLLWWSQQSYFTRAAYFLHQADWLAFLLHGKLGISDYHNALKLGYDVGDLCYPNWLKTLPISSLLPQVLPPGTPVAPVTPEIARQLQLSEACLVCAGTTDSIAAFLASGATQPGEAVTSLGSTLVLKLLSEKQVEAAEYGIYSHRLGNLWLAGGASNTGGAVLRHFFTDAELSSLSRQIDPQQESTLDYYPLLQPGERFPFNNPELAPKLTPRPDNPAAFLHGLLESLARIEALGYRRLQELEATPVRRVYTAGGGAKNSIWQAIRERQLQVPVTVSRQIEAAFGTALLAKSGSQLGLFNS